MANGNWVWNISIIIPNYLFKQFGLKNITDRNMSYAWESPYTGTPPLAVPKCGFDGNGCQVPAFELYKGYIISGIAVFAFLILGGITVAGFIV
jgi:hypothetical protein